MPTMNAAQTNTLKTLPQELLVSILSFCSLQQVLRLRQCCKFLEGISRQRAVWISLLTRLAQEWDIALAQFYPFDPNTTAQDLERAVTARYRLFSMMSSNPKYLPLLSARRRFQLVSATPWRASFFAQGGKWLAAIVEQSLRIYHIAPDLRQPNPERIVVEMKLDVSAHTHLYLFWGCSSADNSTIEIEEWDDDDVANGARHWVYNVHIPPSCASGLAAPEITFRGTIHTGAAAFSSLDGPFDPFFISTDPPDEHFLWYPESGSIPVTLPPDLGLFFYRTGVIFRPDTSNFGLQVFTFPVPSQPPPADSTLSTTKLELEPTNSFSWLHELHDIVPNQGHITALCRFTSTTPTSSSSDPDGLLFRFTVMIQYRPHFDDEDYVDDEEEKARIVSANPDATRIHFLHKALFAVKNPVDGSVIGHRLESRGTEEVQTFVVPQNNSIPAFDTSSYASSWFTRSPVIFSPSNTDGDEESAYWQLKICCSLERDGDRGGRDRGATLSLQVEDRVEEGGEEAETFEHEPEFCSFSGRAIVRTSHVLHVLDFV
ncbi:hypothetical protein DL96DRAFT_525801 [Flagelloscypha sp. PMI_526]|nr:hypothetical protein DL96DRAFT_525801 [Flagelloscypha sp. PMI_526]